MGGAAAGIGATIKDAVNNALSLPQTIGGWTFGAFGHHISLPSYTINRFAKGTPFAPGGMALVGERGAELVNLPRGASVENAQQTAKLMAGSDGSGGNTYMTIHVAGSVTSANDLADVIAVRMRTKERRRTVVTVNPGMALV